MPEDAEKQERLRELELLGVTSWQEANARQKAALDRMTEKFRAIYEIVYLVDIDTAMDLNIGAKAAIIAIREELAK